MEGKEEYQDNSSNESVEDILKPKQSEDKTFAFEISDQDQNYNDPDQEAKQPEEKQGFLASVKEKVAAAKEEKELEKDSEQEKQGFFSSIKEKVAAAKEEKELEKEEEIGQKQGFLASVKEKLAAAKETKELEKEEEPEKQGFFSSVKEKVAVAKEEKESQGSEKKTGFHSSIKEKLTLARESRKETLDKTAGLNFNIKGEISETVSEEKTIFQQTLTPLSSAEISILQAEVAADETIFRQIEVGRAATLARQQIGFGIGIMMAFFFYLAQGIYYFTDTLMNAEVPSWTPQILAGEPIEAALFAAGAVIPILMVFVISTGTRQLISGLVDMKLEKIIWGIISFVIALASFAVLWRGDVIGALMFGGIYLVILFIARVFRI